MEQEHVAGLGWLGNGEGNGWALAGQGRMEPGGVTAEELELGRTHFAHR